MARQCKATTQAGTRCKVKAWAGEEYCGKHKKSRARQIETEQVKGSLTKHAKGGYLEELAEFAKNFELPTVELALAGAMLELSKIGPAPELSSYRRKWWSFVADILKILETRADRETAKVIEFHTSNPNDLTLSDLIGEISADYTGALNGSPPKTN